MMDHGSESEELQQTGCTDPVFVTNTPLATRGCLGCELYLPFFSPHCHLDTSMQNNGMVYGCEENQKKKKKKQESMSP